MSDFLNDLYKDLVNASEDLNKISESVSKGGRLYKAFKEVKRKEYIDFVNDNIGIDASMLTESQLRKAINIAEEKSRADSKGSPTFYDYLEQEILKEMQ